jgi:hypothetical protein
MVMELYRWHSGIELSRKNKIYKAVRANVIVPYKLSLFSPIPA